MSLPIYTFSEGFALFSEKNQQRSLEAFGHDVSPENNGAKNTWSNDQWMTAITGELGEAASALKAINRRQLSKDMIVTELDIVKELADLVTYADLLATQLGYNLGEVMADKFNEVSDRVDSRIKIT